ncbi:hypothetical protein [Planktothrix agardhii]|uniref:hypothetical protein n=1 Tax=Planktothrix agardhii TaxID=1160 RepID=UPI0004250249|nr:hypothetical protein [Planktothrix agardhii]CAD0232248.1 conserved exported hypothetical protein [Planktothrix agardhii]CAD5981306.1 hypothetical protein NO758_04705 [Planktothrix agardhii]
MQISSPQKRHKFAQPMALLMSGLLMIPVLSSCGGSKSYSNPPPPVDDTRGGAVAPPPPQQPQAKQGFSNGQKVAVLVGAAALYYIYNQHKDRTEQGSQGQYYLSKNGRVYYRDAEGRAHWVTPPAEGIQVPEEQAKPYQDFEGYNGRSTGLNINDVVQNSVPPTR